MLMSLGIHLYSLHLDAQYGQTRHLSTQLRSGVRTGRRLLWSTTPLLPTLLSRPQDPCRASLHKRGLAQSPSCDCGQRQTMNHIVDTCPRTKFEGGLNRLHEADDDAVIWLESTVDCSTREIILQTFYLENNFWLSRCLHVRLFPADVCRWRPRRNQCNLTFKLSVNYCRTNTWKNFLANVS